MEYSRKISRLFFLKLTRNNTIGTGENILYFDNKFRIENIGYLNSRLFKKLKTDNVVYIYEKIYYKNIAIFVDRVKDYIIQKGETTVGTNLVFYLRDIVFAWYTTELSELERANLRENLDI